MHVNPPQSCVGRQPIEMDIHRVAAQTQLYVKIMSVQLLCVHPLLQYALPTWSSKVGGSHEADSGSDRRMGLIINI